MPATSIQYAAYLSFCLNKVSVPCRRHTLLKEDLRFSVCLQDTPVQDDDEEEEEEAEEESE